MLLPNVIEKTGKSSRAFDLPTKLLQDRIVYFYGVVDDDAANIIIMQLLWLQSDNPTKDIDLYINSNGGFVSQGLAIFDVIEKLKCKVNTVCVGQASSMAAFLLASGTGVRKASKNSRIMLHSVGAGYEGQFPDMEVNFKETKHCQETMMKYITEFTKGKSTLEFIRDKTLRDYFMSAEEAIEIGLIDEIL